MTKRLLTELFPNFVKKSQIQYLSPGPFGWGLDAAELEKARVYLKPGQQAPEGANVQTGPQGGKYYDEGGGGAAAGPDAQGDQPTYESVPEDMADRQQVAVDEMQQINQQRMAEYQDAQAAGPEALAEWEAGDAQRKEGEAEARADIEGLRDARAQGPEAEAAYKDKRKQEESAKYQEMVAQVEAELPNKVIEDGPLKGMTYGEADKQIKEFADKVDAEVGARREKVDKLTEILSGQTKEERQKGVDSAMAEIETLRAQNVAEAQEVDPSAQGGQTSPPAQDMLSEISEEFNRSLPPGLNRRIEALLDNPQLTNEQSVDMLSEISEKFNVSLPSGLNRRIEALLDTEAAGQTSPQEGSGGFTPASDDPGSQRMGGSDFGQGVQPEGRVSEQTSPPDVSEPAFDGQGNIQTPGSDPYPISELTGSDEEAVNALGEQYQQGGGSNPSELLSGYDGPLTEDGIAQHLSDKVQYDDAFISDNDYNNAIDFASWVGGQAGNDTQKMAKMMQKYNVDNKRRDPIILSNKGGRQRR